MFLFLQMKMENNVYIQHLQEISIHTFISILGNIFVFDMRHYFRWQTFYYRKKFHLGNEWWNMDWIYWFLKTREKREFIETQLLSTPNWGVWQSWQAWNITKLSSTLCYYSNLSKSVTASWTFKSLSITKGNFFKDFLILFFLHNIWKINWSSIVDFFWI